VDMSDLEATAARETEGMDVDFKSTFDTSAAGWCEIVKDIVAFANSGGGAIVFGVNDDGSCAAADIEAVCAVDPAAIADKVKKYTSLHFAGFSLKPSLRAGQRVAVLQIDGVSMPMVFTAPGTYDVGAGKQKTAFSLGTVYFRHGAKSEPGNTDDLRHALERELSRIRSSWLDGIAKVVTAPVGATVSVLPAVVKLTGTEEATRVRLVNDDDAPAFKAVRTDLLYPYRQKELVTQVNKLLDGALVISAHDVYSVRKAHHIDGQPTFYYKPQYSSPQYSLAFAEWMVEQYRGDPEFFANARARAHAHAS
jgi:Putative DNA-binding domain